jgi:hypothetical protein
VLPVGPTAATTEDAEDVDGGPLGVMPVGPTTTPSEVEESVDGGPSGGAINGSGSGQHRS